MLRVVVMTAGPRKFHILIVTSALALAACAPTRPPVNEMDAASRALGAARQAAGPEWAAADYREAGRLFDRAQAALARGDNDEALRLARRAEAMADFSAARANEARLRAEVERVRHENALLQAELATGAEGQP